MARPSLSVRVNFVRMFVVIAMSAYIYARREKGLATLDYSTFNAKLLTTSPPHETLDNPSTEMV